jgi:hypothetical protein
LIAAETLLQALQYIHRRDGNDFTVNKAECLGIIVLLGGSPLD